MKRIILVLIGILLIGCTRYVEVPVNVTVEKIVYVNQTIVEIEKEPCKENISIPTYNREREIELIRRISFLEGQTDKYFGNSTECDDYLNKTQVKLEDCEEELCYKWNSSWC